MKGKTEHMKISNLARYAVGVIAAGAIFAGCSANGASPTTPGTGVSLAKHHGIALSAVDKRFLIVRHGFHGRRAPSSETRGVYTNEFAATSNNVIGFPKNNTTNGPSICSESTGSNVNGIGVDHKGNLIVPNAFSGVIVYSGPTMCGAQLANIPDALGQAADAAANDAANGMIVVGHASGIVATCTVSSNSCTQISNSSITGFSQVAMDKGGNCYATAFDSVSFLPSLWYWAGCTGTGIELGSAQGFNQSATGGIDVDNKGNLVVTEQGAPSSLTVYSGCGTGTCTLVSGPTALSGAGSNDCVYGHLGRQNERYACGDATLGQVDVYTYLPSRTPTYLYSFNNGLSASTIIEAASYAPSSGSK
jgi:hypothetical protein